MEHSSHAHPSDADGSSFGLSALSYASCTITSQNTSPSQQTNDSPNQQARRLQLRNTGFRAPILPFRRISPLLGASANGIEPFTRPVNSENSPSSVEKRSIVGEDLPQSPVNILQEIHKISTRKKRGSPRPGFGAIFEDSSGRENASETSWYSGGSSECSPVAPTMTPVRRSQLREISVNRTTPPPFSSPLVKHVKSRTMNRSKLRSASSEAAQYIEHLESELASAHARLDLQPSPKTSKLRAAKLRTLTTENRNLKQENSEWQKDFESRVQDERSKRLDADMELRTGMRMLEDEMEMKNARMAELEWELESMRVRMRDLEGLEAINHNLEKRIEALTNLLVQSPTKIELPSASTSPIRTDPSKRTSRPRSMFPRVPPSPGGLRTSLATVSESAFGRSQSMGGFPDNVGTPEEATKQTPDGDDVQSPSDNGDMASPDSMRQSEAHDGRLRTSASYRSAPSSASKRTSIRSSCSFGPIAWGLPDHEHSPATKQRRTRRFPSGSNSLKPLILPSTTDVSFTPTSAPSFPQTNATARRDISDISLDPASASLSPTEDDSTPEPPGRQRSASWAQEQTLKALEGRFNKPNDFGGDGSRMSQSPTIESEEQSMGFGETSTGNRKRLSRPRSLQKELEEAEVEQGFLEGSAESDRLEVHEDSLVPVTGDQNMVSIDPATLKAPPPSAHRQQRRQALDTETTPRPIMNQFPLACATPHSVKGFPSTTLSNDHAHGIFSRLTDIITTTKQDPFILARRLLTNAWSLGCKRLGGIGWWLLGLVYATRWQKRKRKADIGTAEDASTKSDFDWQHFSAQASRSRAAEHYFRDYGGTHNQRESWISPPHMPRVAPPIPPPPDARREPHLFPCDRCEEPSSRRTLRLWLQFSLTIILAVGMAVKHGPRALLASDEEHHAMPTQANECEREPLLREQRRKRHPRILAHRSDEISEQSKDSHDSGYVSITFAETLGPADFES